LRGLPRPPMQAFGREDQLRIALRVGLSALAFTGRLANALAGSSEFRHEPRLLILSKRPGNDP
jgi:hypothetical protein